ncbi:ice nucleation protein-like [Palaemon carinicauda]|uniref:ice nucleation protein-like n=1 Tax=Palaemon carinicauda TaxID=392227 RepID=UPI0035B63268
MRTRKGALEAAVVTLLVVCQQGGARPQSNLPIADLIPTEGIQSRPEEDLKLLDLTSSPLNEVNADLLPLGSRRRNPTDSPNTDDVQFRINDSPLLTEAVGAPTTTGSAGDVQFTFPDPSVSGSGSGVSLPAGPGQGRAFPGSGGGRDLSYDPGSPSFGNVSPSKLGGGGDFDQTSFGTGSEFGGSISDQFGGSASSQFGGSDFNQFGGSGSTQFGEIGFDQFGGSDSTQFGGSSSTQFGGSGSTQFGESSLGQFGGSDLTQFGGSDSTHFGGSGSTQFEGSGSAQFGGSDSNQFGGSGSTQFGGSGLDNFGGSGSTQFGGSGSTQFGGSGSTQFGGSGLDNFGGSGSTQFGGSGSTQFGGSDSTQFGGSDSTQFGGSGLDQFGGSGSSQFGGSGSTQFGGSDSTQFEGSDSTQFGGIGLDQFGGSDSTQFGGSGLSQFGESGSTQFGGSDSTQFGGSDSTQFGGIGLDQFGGSDSTQFGGSGLDQFGGSGLSQFGESGSTQFGGSGSTQFGGSDSTQFGGSDSTQFGGSDSTQFGGIGLDQFRGSGSTQFGGHDSTLFGGSDLTQFGGDSTNQFGGDKPQTADLPSLSSSSDFGVKIVDDVQDSLPDRTLGDGNQKIFNNQQSPSDLLSFFLPGHKTQHHSNNRGSNPIGDLLALGAGPIKKIFNLLTLGTFGGDSQSNPLSAIGLGGDAIGELVQVASSGLDDLARETSAGIRLAQDEVRFQANEKVRQFINNLQQTGRTVGVIGQNTYRSLLQKKDALGKLLMGVVTNLGRYINTSVGDTFEKVGNTANVFGKFVSDLKVAILNSLIAKGENVRELVSGTVGTVGSAFRDFSSAAQSAAEDSIKAITGLKEKNFR